MKLLLAEDDAKLAKLLLHLMHKDGHLADWVSRGDEVLDYALQTPYDVIILDWMMPGKDGIEVCRELRQNNYDGGILLLTAKDAVDDRVAGLDAGSDDYVTKPVVYAELSARLRSLERRCTNVGMTPGIGKLDTATRTLIAGDITASLTVREFQLLDILLKRFGRIVTRQMILEMIWGYDGEVTDNAVEVLIKLLRKKMESVPTGWKLSNVRGIGYKLEEDSDVSFHS